MMIRALVLLLALAVPVVCHAQERGAIRLEPGGAGRWGHSEIITVPPASSCTGILIRAKGPRSVAPQVVVMPRQDADAAMAALGNKHWPGSPCPTDYVVLQVLIDGVPALTVIPEAAP